MGQTLLMYSILVRCDWCSASSSSVVRLPSLCSDRIRSSSSVMRRKFSVGASLPEEAMFSPDEVFGRVRRDRLVFGLLRV